jgi:hypothetical protein
MVTVDLEGAQALLDLLQRVREGHSANETELEEVLTANAFFTDFYKQRLAIRWSRPGKPGEVVGKVKGRLAIPAAEPSRLLLHRFTSSIETKEVSFHE